MVLLLALRYFLLNVFIFFLLSGVLQGGDAALWRVGPPGHGRENPGGDEESRSSAQRHHIRILQQGDASAFLFSKLLSSTLPSVLIILLYLACYAPCRPS